MPCCCHRLSFLTISGVLTFLLCSLTQSKQTAVTPNGLRLSTGNLLISFSLLQVMQTNVIPKSANLSRKSRLMDITCLLYSDANQMHTVFSMNVRILARPAVV